MKLRELRKDHSSFYIQSFWLNMLQSKPRVCVCMYVRVCVSSLQPKRMNKIWWSFPYMISQIYLLVSFFAVFDISNLIMSCRPFSLFVVAAFSRSQFWSNFLQIFNKKKQKQKNTRCSGVVRCLLLKSARSANDFR